ncbi:MAG: peptidoglycan DD-metalloendopeptidase family protein [Dorea sp.]|uniref:murein hydrolase activator EnvC family protein n=1 Tax=Dorea sp. YH-dor226 TaxID=3151119 RepID=UPI003063041F|nr:peptidoglycan DD-metalloendopeptidase family protein [Dorea sp.]
MIRRKRMISFLLILALSLGTVMQADATEIDDTKKKAEELKKKKQDAENEKASLAEQLESVVAEMEDTKGKIEEKENEISTKEEELIQAKIDENDQYESMKKRIRYMYESGNSQFIEILCESKNISDFLNKAEYISTISSYDREMLVEFQEIVQQVEEQETSLREEYDDLQTMQDDLIEKQENVKELIASKEEEIGQIESDLGDTQDKLAELEAAAAEALRKQQEQQQAAGGSGGTAGGSVITGNGTFTHPCPGYSYISSNFGYREQPLPGASTNHKGIDYAAATGTPIYAAAGGTVVSAGYSGNAGNMIVINHGNGLTTYYMHCHQIFVSAGQTVSKGQNIATVGTTGNSTGPHLHFQVNLNGMPVNPANYF